eukprot:TRINITY_DN27577_c0_g1_i2.p1 TRINITY_DN27577_c0_g1~~TRINITY_DN27577_c0_g1_i2.p1  ORF type:complete len:310 (-),score=39.48 TRINITY_DN27577_c0_g1_i2:316-1245(-)
MCICALVLNGHPDFPFVLIHNREEDWVRETEAPKVHEGNCVYARDCRAGGTFLGMNLSTGKFAALTNTRSKAARPKGAAEPSRGQLVTDMLLKPESTDPAEYSAYSLFHGSALGDQPSANFSKSWPLDCKAHESAWSQSTTPLTAEEVFAHSNEPSGDVRDDSWPKTRWLRSQVTKLLQSLPPGSSVELLRDKLAEILGVSLELEIDELPDLSFSPLPLWSEKVRQCGPLVSHQLWKQAKEGAEKHAEPGEDVGDGEAAYGTSIQSVIISSRSLQQCVYFHRDLMNEDQTPSPWQKFEASWPSTQACRE